VTIELAPEEVSRMAAEAEGKPEEDAAVDPATAAPAWQDEARADPADEAPPRDARTAPAAAPAPASGGFGRSLAAGLAGGVLALALGAFLQWAGLLPTLQVPAVGGDQRLAALEGKVDALAAKVAALPAGIDAAAVEQAVKPLGARVDALDAALGKARDEIAAAAGQGGRGDGVGEAEIAAFAERLDKVEATAEGAENAAGADAGRLSKLEDSLAELGRKVAADAARPGAVAAIPAFALKIAVESGRPFTSELEAFAAVRPDAPEIAPLRAQAEAGVPTLAALAAEAGKAAAAMQTAAQQEGGDGGLFDRLARSARALVRVRPVGDIGGDDPAARIARLEKAVREGRLAEAAAEYAALPEPAKAAGAALMDRVKARLDALGLADSALLATLKAG
jgi:hypothetical protein